MTFIFSKLYIILRRHCISSSFQLKGFQPQNLTLPQHLSKLAFINEINRPSKSPRRFFERVLQSSEGGNKFVAP